MKILKFEAMNYKRLRALEISPDGHLVRITGKNAQGKSSVLDGIEAIFTPASNLPRRPVREGAESALLRASVGEEPGQVDYVLTRRITAAGGGNLVIEAPSGARYQRPQEFADKLWGAISFDPLEFSREKPRVQFEQLRRIVPLDVDADALDGRNKRDFEARTEINRDAARLRGQAAGIQVANENDLPEAAIDTAALIAKLQQAGDFNRVIDRSITDRQLSEEVIASELREAARCEAEAAKLIEEAERRRKRAKDQRAALDGADPIPEPIDTAALAEELRRAQATNSQITERDRRDILEDEAKTLEARAAALTEAMATRTNEKTKALARAKFPVPGLGFGDGEILYNGIPFEQASQAEKIRVSVAIAIAAKPLLRVLCVRDGSLLDSESMRLLDELVVGDDYQCWIEVTSDEGAVGIIIEDGAVQGAPVPALAKPAEKPPRTRKPRADEPADAEVDASQARMEHLIGKDLLTETLPASAAADALSGSTAATPEGKTVRRAKPKPEQGGLL